MLIQLTIMHNTETGDTQVAGLPIAELPTGEQKVAKHFCYSALESARDLIATFKPQEKLSPIALATRIPNLNGGIK